MYVDTDLWIGVVMFFSCISERLLGLKDWCVVSEGVGEFWVGEYF